MKIAVLTDIHAMRAGLAAALSDARAEGFDVLLILGDLLTYGVEPAATLDLVHDAVARDGAILVAGNHDQLYMDLEADLDGGGSDYLQKLPAWLRETVAWTAGRVPPRALQAFAWQPSWAHGPLFAAHANPGAFGDWAYVNSDASADEAAIDLAGRGYRYGLFGHVHRARRYDRGDLSLFTVGSLGQPRDDDDRRLQWSMVELKGDAISVTPRSVAFDRAGHQAAIRATTLSSATQDRLCGFFA